MKSYGQFCAVARSLDLIGDRWTLLIVRELLLGPRRFTDLLDGLPGIARNLLADRLRQLAATGLLEHRETDYALTPRGEELRPVVRALARFGAPELARGPAGDVVLSSSTRIALDARYPDDAEVRVISDTADEVIVDIHGHRLTTSREELLIRLASDAR